MLADKDRADGYKRGRTYLCRHCHEPITVHNRHWVHCSGHWFEMNCKVAGIWILGATTAHPVPYGTVQIFKERKTKGVR